MPQAAAKLSIVIPCRSDPLLERAIWSARHPLCEVVVVLNDPTDAARSLAAAADRVVLIEMANLALARQKGFDSASSGAVLFLDSDCWLPPQSIEAILRALDDHEVVKPHLCYAARNVPERIVAKVRRYTTADSPLPLLPLALRKSIVSKLGGQLFDNRLAWGEDWVLAQRLVKLNIQVARSPEASIIHEPLSMKADLASAWRTGRGRVLQQRAGLHEGRRLLADLRFAGEGLKFRQVRLGYGVAAAIYHLLGWRMSYKIGYYWARVQKSRG